MQFGTPTLIELKTTEACAALCRELGLSFIELSMDLPDYQADKINVDELLLGTRCSGFAMNTATRAVTWPPTRACGKKRC